ncbi:GAF domain-containing protein [Microvirga sp. BT689]|uniref:HWE histidine kinase domain-containing protein n=1 Tax=Microvirga arvi TaxID=2778731 RepID=UPI001950C89D|nr:HWE histidine kinase domain-containing protein [Microvirga arvi]MBM6580512.1 GAF domain-containing protein [Microvirga arvi]
MTQGNAAARDESGIVQDDSAAVEAIGRINVVSSVLELLLDSTGLGFGAVARVTETSWTACAVLDRIGFGLPVGGTLEVATTFCSEIRASGTPIVIDQASTDAVYCTHRTPKMYGFESYIAVPIILRSGEVFGTICALDPKPAKLTDPKILKTLQLFAELIGSQLELGDTLADQRKAIDHQNLLINELNHRVKNTLATVQSIAYQSFKNAQSLAHAHERLERRLMALARVHDVLTQERWDSAELETVVQKAILPFEGVDLQRFRLSGPSIRLPPWQVLPLSMAIHELLTNALKYGALSEPSGWVAIRWNPASDGRTLTFRWSENDGPSVRPPSERGFGTRLIQRGLAQELGGSVEINFNPSGVTCTISIPLTAEPI